MKPRPSSPRRARWGAHLGFAVILLASGCAAPRTFPRPGHLPPHAVVRVQVAGGVVPIPLEDYVRVAILSELSPGNLDSDAAARMFEVQAIVSRTYALAPRHAAEGFDFCAGMHCQLYEPSRIAASRWTKTGTQAIRNTAGVIVRSQTGPAKVVFHADCGGHTSAARDVWNGGDLSYLAAISDEGPARAAHLEWRFAPSRSELIDALNADARTRVGSRLDRIDVLRRDEAGRAQVVALDGEQTPLVRGEELRAVLSRAFGARALRSTRFTVVRAGERFEFIGTGFGHGVGLCQAGALARVEAGATPEDVLAFYFPGTTVAR